MSPRPFSPLALATVLAACASAGGTARPELPPPSPPHDAAVRAAVETARGFVGQREITVGGTRFGDDCAALVRASFSRAGVPLPPAASSAGALHHLARERGLLRKGAPAVGDLVFLADRPAGPPAHVGIVESVADDGTALVLHRTGRGVARLRVNASHPWTLKRGDGRLLNDPLVTGAGRVPAGRLFLAWASMV